MPVIYYKYPQGRSVFILNPVSSILLKHSCLLLFSFLELKSLLYHHVAINWRCKVKGNVPKNEFVYERGSTKNRKVKASIYKTLFTAEFKIFLPRPSSELKVRKTYRLCENNSKQELFWHVNQKDSTCKQTCN